MFLLPGFTRPPFVALVRFGFTDTGCNASGVSGEFLVTGRNIKQQHTPTESNRQDRIGKAEAQTVCWRNLNCRRSDTSRGLDTAMSCPATNCGMQGT